MKGGGFDFRVHGGRRVVIDGAVGKGEHPDRGHKSNEVSPACKPCTHGSVLRGHGLERNGSKKTLRIHLINHCPNDLVLQVKPKQPSLPGFSFKSTSAHGGELARGKRKTARPIDTKQALHLVLRSSKARGSLSMLHPDHCNAIQNLVSELCERWGIRLYRFANVGNHLHLLVRAHSRRAWRGFLRELTGGVAMLVTGARKGRALARSPNGDGPDQVRGFWDHLAFTRIVKFGRDFRGVGLYLIGNIFEAMGVNIKKLRAQGFRIITIGPDG